MRRCSLALIIALIAPSARAEEPAPEPSPLDALDALGLTGTEVPAELQSAAGQLSAPSASAVIDAPLSASTPPPDAPGEVLGWPPRRKVSTSSSRCSEPPRRSFGSRFEGWLPDSEQAIILGALERCEIDAVLLQGKDKVDACVQGGRERNPNLGGRVRLRFIIGRDGLVSEVTTRDSTAGSPWVEACLQGVVQGLRFPPPHGGGIAIITYPFYL